MKRVALIGILCASQAGAQLRDTHLGAGIAVASSGWVSGAGQTLEGSAYLATWRPTVTVRADVGFHRIDLSGAPQSCEMVQPFYCLGRSDQTRSMYGRIGAVVDFTADTRNFGVYIMPLSVGLAVARTQSREQQGPTALCVENGVLVSCASNPPWASFTRSQSTVGPSIGAGAGAHRRFGRIGLHAEGRIAMLPGLDGYRDVGSFSLSLSRRGW